MSRIRIVIAEDHGVVRQGLKVLIHADPGLFVVGEAADGMEAIALARELRPDVVVMDIAMPRMSGLEATRQMAVAAPQTKVLVLSSYTDDDLVQSLLEAGAHGYITKHSASDDLLQGIWAVARGGRYLSGRVAARMRRRWNPDFPRRNGRPAELTARETEVLGWIAAGMATKNIAARLEISFKTVEKHRQSIMSKLDLHDIANLTLYATGHGLLARLEAPGHAPGRENTPAQPPVGATVRTVSCLCPVIC